ncbi:HERV-H LTR-associating protein 2 [Sorex araneus]|uniref:HERV-H LTR-associating protein 2 n=1 Tax=Sorex araneus TaxID=42254 RepID=UPI00243402DF|nr:HERV-H LTR-associating protein 2 [Sorex araneus]
MKAHTVWSSFFIALLSLSRSEDTLFPQFFSLSEIQNEQTVTGRLDADVTLPCSFEIGSEPVIYWRNQESEIVHSFFKNADQDASSRYVNRTSLFQKEIPNGNASLILKRLRLQDEGTYTCYVGTSSGNSWANIVLKLEGFMTPVIEYEETNSSNNLKCSVLCAQPCPNITWQMGDMPISDPIVEESGFNVKSTINIVSPDSFYECAVENLLLEQTWTGRWTKKGGFHKVVVKDVSLLCEFGNNLFQPDEEFIVTWSRVQNGTSSILASFQSSSQNTTTNESRLSFNKEQINQGTISSTLTNIRISDSGKYLCNISSRKYTLLTNQILYVETHLMVNDVASVAVVAVVVVVVVILVFLVLLCTVPALRRRICCFSAVRKLPFSTEKIGAKAHRQDWKDVFGTGNNTGPEKPNDEEELIGLIFQNGNREMEGSAACLLAVWAINGSLSLTADLPLPFGYCSSQPWKTGESSQSIDPLQRLPFWPSLHFETPALLLQIILQPGNIMAPVFASGEGDLCSQGKQHLLRQAEAHRAYQQTGPSLVFQDKHCERALTHFR